MPRPTRSSRLSSTAPLPSSSPTKLSSSRQTSARRQSTNKKTATSSSRRDNKLTMKDKEIHENDKEALSLQEEANPEEEMPSDNEEEKEEEQADEVYEFNGVNYATYHDMVQAKRKRNQQVLEASGLLDMTKTQRRESDASQRGLKRIKTIPTTATGVRRKSNRLQGIASDGLYVDDERSGRFTVLHWETGQGGVVASKNDDNDKPEQAQFYNHRLNDGSDMTLTTALTAHVADKWQTESAVPRIQALQHALSSSAVSSVSSPNTTSNSSRKTTSPASVADLYPYEMAKHASGGKPMQQPKAALLSKLSVDDPNQVAKVVPDRIYGMAVHPSRDHVVVCAGDKSGYVGIWNTSASTTTDSDDRDNVHLFKYHSGAAASLQWTTDGQSLFSTSYDGTCRLWDVNTETVRNVFAAYNDDKEYANQAGFGLDTGYHYWTQFGCLDHRQEECFFVSTSIGSVYHIDGRVAGRGSLTWNQNLSEKKINTISLHPNGYSLATGGLDCQVCLWDLRKFGSKSPKPIATYHGGKSINSGFFSPSGRSLVATTMNNKLDIVHDFHLEKGSLSKPKTVQPTHSIRHDNMTGRWLTTFQAVWHPRLEIFGVGSMSKPRIVEIFSDKERQCAVGGEVLTAVASRLAFHPRTDQIILAGGKSSGRVTIVR